MVVVANLSGRMEFWIFGSVQLSGWVSLVSRLNDYQGNGTLQEPLL